MIKKTEGREPLQTVSTGEAATPAKGTDCFSLHAVAMAAAALFIGIGVPADDIYSPRSMVLLTCGLLCCLAALIVPIRLSHVKRGTIVLSALLAAGIIAQCVFLLVDRGVPLPDILVWPFDVRLVVAGILGVLGLLRSRMVVWLRMGMLTVIFFILTYTIVRVYAHPVIDVFQFQSKGAKLLAQGGNPFDPHQAKFTNVYPREGADFLYGPGTVDFTPTPESPGGTLRHGFPYLPVSLLLVVPAQMFAGDVRYAHIVAILLSAWLMAFARPGRHAALAACLFLFTPRVFYVVREAWTEPLLVFTFSLAMFCACRLPRLLPYALGIFLATKQYTVFFVPLAFLLTSQPGHSLKATFTLLIKAAVTGAIVTLPFALWNFHEFWGSVVEWQLVQPFRLDSTSYLVTLSHLFHGWRAPFWVPFAAVIPAIALALCRCPRTPAGFAVGVTLVSLVFFLFNKQAFTNYYYFTIAAAFWAVAAANFHHQDTKTPREEESRENVSAV